MQRLAWVKETSQLPSPEGIFFLASADSCTVLQMLPLLAGASTLPCASPFSHCLAPFLPTPSWLQFSRLHLWLFYLTQDTLPILSQAFKLFSWPRCPPFHWSTPLPLGLRCCASNSASILCFTATATYPISRLCPPPVPRTSSTLDTPNRCFTSCCY